MAETDSLPLVLNEESAAQADLLGFFARRVFLCCLHSVRERTSSPGFHIPSGFFHNLSALTLLTQCLPAVAEQPTSLPPSTALPFPFVPQIKQDP